MVVKETSTVCHSSFGRYTHTIEGQYVLIFWVQWWRYRPWINLICTYSKQADIKWTQISLLITSYECLLTWCMPSPKFYLIKTIKIFTNIHFNGNSTIESKIITTGPRQPYSFDIGVKEQGNQRTDIFSPRRRNLVPLLHRAKNSIKFSNLWNPFELFYSSDNYHVIRTQRLHGDYILYLQFVRRKFCDHFWDTRINTGIIVCKLEIRLVVHPGNRPVCTVRIGVCT